MKTAMDGTRTYFAAIRKGIESKIEFAALSRVR
jgi:hypothetical protein